MGVRKYLQRRKQRINLLQTHYPLSNTNLSLSFLFKFCWLQNQHFLCLHTRAGALTSPCWCKGARIGRKDGKHQCSERCRTSLQDPQPNRAAELGVSARIGKSLLCSAAGAAKHGQRLSESCQPTGQGLIAKWCPPSAGKGHKCTEPAPASKKFLPLSRFLCLCQSGIPGQGFFWGQVLFRAAQQCKWKEIYLYCLRIFTFSRRAGCHMFSPTLNQMLWFGTSPSKMWTKHLCYE